MSKHIEAIESEASNMGFVQRYILFLLLLASVVNIYELADVEIEFSKPKVNTDRRPTEIERMYNNSFISDIQFTFGNNKSGEVFYAHKYVLAISSPVFTEMFYTKSKKATESIYLPEHSSEAIAGFFGFIYKEECPTDYEKDLDVLCLIKQYQVVSFDVLCSTSFERTVEVQKSCKFLDQFLEMKAKALAEICLGKLDLYTEEYFASEYFLNIKQSTLGILLDRDTLYYNETDIFKAVMKWADHQCSNQSLKSTPENRRMVLGNAIYSIRFLSMNHTEFVANVVPTEILHDNETVAIIKAMIGEEVPGLAWDSAKLRSKRFPKNEWPTAPPVKENSFFTYYFWIFWHYFLILIYYLIFVMGIIFCFLIARSVITGKPI